MQLEQFCPMLYNRKNKNEILEKKNLDCVYKLMKHFLESIVYLVETCRNINNSKRFSTLSPSHLRF